MLLTSPEFALRLARCIKGKIQLAVVPQLLLTFAFFHFFQLFRHWLVSPSHFTPVGARTNDFSQPEPFLYKLQANTCLSRPLDSILTTNSFY